MQVLKIFVSGVADDQSLVRDAITRAIMSLHLESVRLEIDYSTRNQPRENILRGLYDCHVFLGVYDPTQYSKLNPTENISTTEFEFEQAQAARKPTLVFVKNVKPVEQASPHQDEFMARVIEFGVGKFDVFRFDQPDQLTHLIASTLPELLRVRFHLVATCPPFQAPPMLPTLVRRDHVLKQIMDALAASKLVVIHGVADEGGVGKTQMAICAAHHVRAAFPDGILWANIATTRPADILANWARQLGGLDVLGRGDLRFVFRPLSMEARSAAEVITRINAVHNLLQGKRVLAILDGVVDERDEEKIQPLLDALSDCTVLITSRTSRLPSFRFATLIRLPPLTEDEAWQLFCLMAGERRFDHYRALVSKIAQSVDFLPLAIELVASQLREDETWTLNSAVRMLENERHTPETIRRGDRRVSGMRAAFNTCYHRLNSDDKKFLQMLSVFAGETFDVEAVQFVTDTVRDTTKDALERLVRLAWVKKHSQTRYTLHPALRAFAYSKLENTDEAHLRMATYYCALAKENGKKLQGPEIHTALEILDTELGNILAGHQWAQTWNDRLGWELCRDYIYGAMIYYFNLKSMWSDWIAWSVVGIEASYKLNDERSASSIAGGLGLVYYRRGELDQAMEFYKQALAIMEKFGRQTGMAAIHTNLGNVQTERREWNDAIESYAKALRLYERLGDWHGQAQVRANLGMLYAKYGDRTKARASWLQALEILDYLGAEREADIVRKWLQGLVR